MMTSVVPNKYAIILIKEAEGFSANPYVCPAGYLSIGYGLNLEADARYKNMPIEEKKKLTITEKQASDEVKNKVCSIEKSIRNYTWFQNCNGIRQAVLIDMVYNMGLTKFLTFKKMLQALRGRDYNLACIEMQDSLWYDQVKSRAVRDIKIMESGKEA